MASKPRRGVPRNPPDFAVIGRAALLFPTTIVAATMCVVAAFLMRAMHTKTEPGTAVDWRGLSHPSSRNTRTSKGGWLAPSSGDSRPSLLVLYGVRRQWQMLNRHGRWGSCLSLPPVDGDGGTNPVAHQSLTAACDCVWVLQSLLAVERGWGRSDHAEVTSSGPIRAAINGHESTVAPAPPTPTVGFAAAP